MAGVWWQVEMNVVATLSHLSNTYSDDTQMDCASCFCNLSCNKENQELMVKQVRDFRLWLTEVTETENS